MSADSSNPYLTPQSQDQAAPLSTQREQAQRRIRWALVALVIPTWCNWACIFLAGSQTFFSDMLMMVLGVMNLVGLFLLFTFLWLAGVYVLDAAAICLHMIFGGPVSREAWLETMYRALWPINLAARIGALLWILWLYLFFFAGHPGGFALDVFFQLLAHALGAWVYGNVFLQWYRLRNSKAAEMHAM